MRTGLLRWADAVPMPWKNGGGVTTELLGSPEGAGMGTFDWRISVAEVAADGPFSSFDGIDRVIMLIEGAGMELTVDGEVRSLAPLEPLSFAGESVTTCALPGGPTRDLNVMTRRGRFASSLVVRRGPAREVVQVDAGEDLVVLCLSGAAAVDAVDAVDVGDGPIRLGPLDACHQHGPGSVAVSADPDLVPDLVLDLVLVRIRQSGS